MKDEIIFALYKDKPIGNKKLFNKQCEKYAKQININEMYRKIVNYQIDTYGNTLNNFDPTWFEKNKLLGKISKKINNKHFKERGNENEL